MEFIQSHKESNLEAKLRLSRNVRKLEVCEFVGQEICKC